MFYEGDILGIHIEPTSKCNAKCPRNVHGSSHLNKVKLNILNKNPVEYNAIS